MHIFVTVIEENGFSRAATKLNLTQPAVSYQMRRLEEVLGVTLFLKKARSVILTEAGRVLHEHAIRINETLKHAECCLEVMAPEPSGTIRIGAIDSVLNYFLPHVLRDFKKRNPQVAAIAQCMSSNEAVDKLMSRELDVVLVGDQYDHQEIRAEKLTEERIRLVCGQTHRFFYRNTVRSSELVETRCVCFSKERPEGRLISDYLSDTGLVIRPVLHTDSVEMLKRIVSTGEAMGFLPEMVVNSGWWDGETGTDKQYRFIDTSPEIRRSLFLASLEDSYSNTMIRSLIGDIRQQAAQWNRFTKAAALEDHTAESIALIGIRPRYEATGTIQEPLYVASS